MSMRDQLAEMVEAHGLYTVLDALESVCYERRNEDGRLDSARNFEETAISLNDLKTELEEHFRE